MVFAGALAGGALGAGQHVVLFGNTLSRAAAYLTVALAGTIGYVFGSWLGWGIGAVAGRPFVERHGRFLHLDEERLARADAWFRRRGRSAVLLGRLTPVVRSFVSIPAGFEQMPLAPYTLLTALGSAIWCFALAGVGLGVGTGYELFHHVFDYVSLGVVAAIVLGGVAVVIRRRRLAPALVEGEPQTESET